MAGVDMIPHPQPDRTPEAMTRRARVVLLLAVARNGLIAASVIAFPHLFDSAAWLDVSRFGIGLLGWGVVLGLVAGICAVAAWLRHASIARVGLGASAVLTAMICAGVLASFVQSLTGPNPFSPAIPILLGALVGYDLVMCAQPVRTPLERVLTRLRTASTG